MQTDKVFRMTALTISRPTFLYFFELLFWHVCAAIVQLALVIHLDELGINRFKLEIQI